ncbi:penicillin acylase family protein [Caballeronia sordidicola]|nr:penicillin acylase family protein [Caballeronia sordidicola]
MKPTNAPVAQAAQIDEAAPTPLHATIRRTAYGVPHIESADWDGLGYGYGYAQATDDLCTLADGFVTWHGERSRYFGAAEHMPMYSTIGRPVNLDADFYHRFLIDDAAIDRFQSQQSHAIQALAHGYAAGYDRYMKEVKAGGHAGAHVACRAAPWLKPIDARDVYRRMLAAIYAGGYARFVHAVANAQPPSSTVAQMSARQESVALSEAKVPYLQAGGAAGIGSNAIAFGSAATGTSSGLLLGNPHWFWRGPDRFYQVQLTIPGKLDVSGAAFLGAPVVMIGFNRDVAWSLTVSSARRFGLFRLALAPGHTDTYLIDGKPEPMRGERISVETRNADGSTGTITRTLYRTRFGPLVDLSGLSPALAANAQTAFAIRDVNADNARTFDTFLRWDRADSLESFMRITRDDASMPWVNTLAVGRNDARAWYADIGAIPDVPAALAAHCTIEPIARALAAKARGVPVLDGSRAACNWADEPAARQQGALPSVRMPNLVRRDYVANMNNSYELANPVAPLAGYDAIFDSQNGLSLRAQLGLQMIRARIEGRDGFVGKGADSASVRAMTLDSRALSAERFKADVLKAACTDERAQQTPTLDAACDALRNWNDTGNADARGANLWDAFWSHLQVAKTGWSYTVPASVSDPLNTPRGLTLDAAFARETLIAAVDDLHRAHLAPDSPRGAALYATRAGVRVPMFGGCTSQGYFTAACSQEHVDSPDGLALDGDPNGNSYMQVVSFDADGPQAWTFLTTSLSDDPASPHAGDYTQRYATKSWVRIPYTREQIDADPALSVTELNSER